MKPQSCKAKGRELQKKVVRHILTAFSHTLREGDVRSTSMGAGGEDVLLSPLAAFWFPFSVECKKVERLNLWQAVRQSSHHCTRKTPLIVFSRNYDRLYACLPASYRHPLQQHPLFLMDGVNHHKQVDVHDCRDRRTHIWQLLTPLKNSKAPFVLLMNHKTLGEYHIMPFQHFMEQIAHFQMQRDKLAQSNEPAEDVIVID